MGQGSVYDRACDGNVTATALHDYFDARHYSSMLMLRSQHRNIGRGDISNVYGVEFRVAQILQRQTIRELRLRTSTTLKVSDYVQDRFTYPFSICEHVVWRTSGPSTDLS